MPKSSCRLLVEGLAPKIRLSRSQAEPPSQGGLRDEWFSQRAMWVHAPREQRLSRQSQVSWDSQKQHEARVARMDEIKEELVKLGRGMK